MPRLKSCSQMRGRGLRGLALDKGAVTARVCPSDPRPSFWEVANRLQEVFPYVEGYWNSGVCSLHVHTRACVSEFGPRYPGGVWLCPPSSRPNMGPQAPSVPALPATRDRDENGVSPSPFSVILVIERSLQRMKVAELTLTTL